MAKKEPTFTKQEFKSLYFQKADEQILSGSLTEKERLNETDVTKFYVNNADAWANNRTSLEAAVNELILTGVKSEKDTAKLFLNALHETYSQLDFENEAYKQREQAEYDALTDDRKKEIWERAKRDLQALQNIEEMFNSNSDDAKEYKNAMTKLIHIYSNGKIKLREHMYPEEKKSLHEMKLENGMTVIL